MKTAKLVLKDDGPSLEELSVPGMLEDSTLQLRQDMERFTTPIPFKIRDDILSHKMPNFTAHSTKTDRWVTISNVQRPLTADITEVSVNEEVQECFHIIQGKKEFVLVTWG